MNGLIFYRKTWLISALWCGSLSHSPLGPLLFPWISSEPRAWVQREWSTPHELPIAPTPPQSQPEHTLAIHLKLQLLILHPQVTMPFDTLKPREVDGAAMMILFYRQGTEAQGFT